MKVAVIGSGYVGTTTAVVLASIGHSVTGVDIDESKVHKLEQGVLPFIEPRLDTLLEAMLNKQQLHFTTDIGSAIRTHSVIMLTVPTPSTLDGKADLTALQSAADEIAKNLNSYKLIITKSTVPVGTNKWLSEYLTEQVGSDEKFDVISNPEFLREGSALYDSLHPERTVIGGMSEQAIHMVKRLYEPLNSRVVVTDWNSAELIKYASNAFLAAKISFVNEIARIADKTGADIEDVAYGMGLDSRIGHGNLKAGLGYGGSCFPKDVKALIATGRQVGADTSLLETIEHTNNTQYTLYIEKIKRHMRTKDKNPWTIGVLGLTFKPDTDDQRESPAIVMIDSLLSEGVSVRLLDPTVKDIRQTPWANGKNNICVVHSIEDVLRDVDAAVVCTDWKEFGEFDWRKAQGLMRQTLIVDTRNMFSPDQMNALGIEYVAVGRRGAT